MKAFLAAVVSLATALTLPGQVLLNPYRFPAGGGGGGSPAYVQSAAKDSGSTAADTLAFAGGNSGGNLLVVCVRQGGTGGTCSITDSRSNSYTALTSPLPLTTTGDHTFRIFYAKNCAAGANTVTCTFGASATMRWIIHEFSGCSTSAPFDTAAARDQLASGAPSSGNATPSGSNVLLFGACSTTGANTFTAGSGFTLAQQIPAPASTGKMASEYRIVTGASGSYAAGFTLDSGADTGCALAVFK